MLLENKCIYIFFKNVDVIKIESNEDEIDETSFNDKI